jgi:hypothetical protein
MIYWLAIRYGAQLKVALGACHHIEMNAYPFGFFMPVTNPQIFVECVAEWTQE